MKRRKFITLVGGTVAAWPIAVRAQQQDRIARIGYLGNLAANPQFTEAFRQGLRDLGWVEKRNVVIEFRDAQGKPELLPVFAAELVTNRVDVILVTSTAAALAAKKATTNVPIVFATVPDPVTSGLVVSLSHPGGNATGLSNQGSDTLAKSLQLLKQAVPGITRVAILRQPGAFGELTEKDMLGQAEGAARTLGVQGHVVEARLPADIGRAFAEIAAARAQGLMVMTSGMFISERAHIVDLAAKNTLPSVYPWREAVDVGGLLSYGPSFVDLFRRSAAYVDKILKGAKPADLAVEQPTKFETVINLKTAKALGLTIPPLLLAHADEVIE